MLHKPVTRMAAVLHQLGFAACMGAALGFAGCSGEPIEHPTVPVRLVPQGGDDQTAFRGTLVAIPPSVMVVDEFDNPVPNATVNFVVASGGGSATGASAITGSAGEWLPSGVGHLAPHQGQTRLLLRRYGTAFRVNRSPLLPTLWVAGSQRRQCRRPGCISARGWCLACYTPSVGPPSPRASTAYNPSTNSWSAKAPLPTQGAFAQANWPTSDGP